MTAEECDRIARAFESEAERYERDGQSTRPGRVFDWRTIAEHFRKVARLIRSWPVEEPASLAEQVNTRLYQVLSRLEWHDEECPICQEPTCPICNKCHTEGHAPDCTLKLALAWIPTEPSPAVEEIQP